MSPVNYVKLMLHSVKHIPFICHRVVPETTRVNMIKFVWEHNNLSDLATAHSFIDPKWKINFRGKLAVFS